MKHLFILPFLILLISCGGEISEDNETNDGTDSTATVIDSLTYFNDQIALNPKSSDLYYQRALYKIGKGDNVSSEADLEMAIALDTANLDAHVLYADLKLALIHIDTSKAHYEFVLTRDTMNTRSMLGLSKINFLLDNFATADAYISKTLQIDPHMAEAYFMRGIIYRSDYYTTARQTSWDIAVSSFQTTVEQDPDYYSAYVEMGVMHDQIGSELAGEYYNSALEIAPESYEANYNLGMYHQNRGEMDQALSLYRKLNQIDSTWADPYYNQGYIHLIIKEGDLDSSIYYFTKAVDLDPTYYQAYNNLGLAYETKGDIENAKKYYAKAIDANPDFQLAKDNLNSLQ